MTTTVRDSAGAPASSAAARGPRGIPRAAWLCALIAAVNALAWSFLIPPFHVPDENAHVAYIQYLAEKGTPPKHPFAGLSQEEDDTLSAIGFYATIGNSNARVPTGPRADAKLAQVERSHPSRVSRSDAGSATNNPPLYYALGAVVYDIAPTRLPSTVVVLPLTGELTPANASRERPRLTKHKTGAASALSGRASGMPTGPSLHPGRRPPVATTAPPGLRITSPSGGPGFPNEPMTVATRPVLAPTRPGP